MVKAKYVNNTMMCIYGVTVHIATSDIHYENGDILNANAKKKK